MTEDERRRRVLRLKALASKELAKDGLRPPPSWRVEILPDMTLCAHDPETPDGSQHGRIRAGIRIDRSHQIPDALLATQMAVQARAALRRAHTYAAQRRAQRTGSFAEGWSALAHPLAVALGRHVGLGGEHLPPVRRRPNDGLHPATRHPLMFERAITWDLMSVNMGLTLHMAGEGVPTRLESKPGLTTLQVAIPLPSSMSAALRGERLSRLVGIDPTGEDEVDKALAALTIADVEDLPGSALGAGCAIKITFKQTQWIPWGRAPDDVARLIALSPEIC